MNGSNNALYLHSSSGCVQILTTSLLYEIGTKNKGMLRFEGELGSEERLLLLFFFEVIMSDIWLQIYKTLCL